MTLEQILIAGIATESTAVVTLFGIVLHSYRTCEKERKQLWRHIIRIYKYLPVDAPRSLEDVDDSDE